MVAQGSAGFIWKRRGATSSLHVTCSNSHSSSAARLAGWVATLPPLKLQVLARGPSRGAKRGNKPARQQSENVGRIGRGRQLSQAWYLCKVEDVEFHQELGLVRITRKSVSMKSSPSLKRRQLMFVGDSA